MLTREHAQDLSAQIETFFANDDGPPVKMVNNLDWLGERAAARIPARHRQALRGEPDDPARLGQAALRVARGRDLVHRVLVHAAAGVRLPTSSTAATAAACRSARPTSGATSSRASISCAGLEGKTVYGLTTPLLTDSDGEEVRQEREGRRLPRPEADVAVRLLPVLAEHRGRQRRAVSALADRAGRARRSSRSSRRWAPSGWRQRALAEDLTRRVHGDAERSAEVLRATEALFGGGDLRGVGGDLLDDALAAAPSITVPREPVRGGGGADRRPAGRGRRLPVEVGRPPPAGRGRRRRQRRPARDVVGRDARDDAGSDRRAAAGVAARQAQQLRHSRSRSRALPAAARRVGLERPELARVAQAAHEQRIAPARSERRDRQLRVGGRIELHRLRAGTPGVCSSRLVERRPADRVAIAACRRQLDAEDAAAPAGAVGRNQVTGDRLARARRSRSARRRPTSAPSAAAASRAARRSRPAARARSASQPARWSDRHARGLHQRARRPTGGLNMPREQRAQRAQPQPPEIGDRQRLRRGREPLDVEQLLGPQAGGRVEHQAVRDRQQLARQQRLGRAGIEPERRRRHARDLQRPHQRAEVPLGARPARRS